MSAAGRLRPVSGMRPDPTAVFTTQCDRCFREIDARGHIGMECGPCVLAAQAVWPWAVPLDGQVSAS